MESLGRTDLQTPTPPAQSHTTGFCLDTAVFLAPVGKTSVCLPEQIWETLLRQEIFYLANYSYRVSYKLRFYTLNWLLPKPGRQGADKGCVKEITKKETMKDN